MIIGRFPDTRVILLSRHSKNSTAASFCEKWACYFLCEDCSPRKSLLQSSSPELRMLRMR